MITDALLNVLFSVLGAVISIFPTYTIPQGPGFSAIAAANIIIPLDIWFFWLGVTITFTGIGLIYYGVLLIIRLIRGA